MKYNIMKRLIALSTILILGFSVCKAQNKEVQTKLNISNNLKWSERTAISVLNNNPKVWQLDGNEKPKWDYKMGFLLKNYIKKQTMQNT